MTASYLAADPIYKKPGETLKLGIDFTLYGLVSGETLTGTPTASVTTLTASSLVVNSATFTNRKGGTVAIGKGVQLTLAGGTAGQDYELDVTATTTNGQTLVGRIPVFVRDG